MKHIFIVYYDFDLGGVQRKMTDLANYTSREKKYQDVVVHLIVETEGQFSFRPFLNKTNQRIIFHTFPKFYFNRFNKFIFRTYMLFLFLRYRPVSILTFFHYALPYLYFLKKVPFLTTKLIVGQDNIFSFFDRDPNLDYFMTDKKVKKLFSFVDLIITQTNYARDDLVKTLAISPKKVKVVPNWIMDTPYKKTKKKYDLIYAGRFEKQKSLEKMIEVFSLVVAQIPNSKLCLIGGGSQKSMVKDLVVQKKLTKNVAIKPSTYLVKDEIKKSKLFILTSRFEGHPMVLLEAMALGVVPVILHYPGVDEYVISGTNGFIENSIKELSNQIIKLLRDETRQSLISAQTRKIVRESYGQSLLIETIDILLGKNY